jgi:hypothetical protein
MSSSETHKIITKYGMKKGSKIKSTEVVDFEIIYETVSIVSKGENYYKRVKDLFNDYMSDSDSRKLTKFLTLLMSDSEIGLEGVNYFNTLNKSIMHKMPEILDEIEYEEDLKLFTTLSKIISIYNKLIVESKNIVDEFKMLEKHAAKKNIKYSSVLSEIGKGLQEGRPPTLKALKLVSNYFYIDQPADINNKINDDIEITVEILKRMIDWNSINKSLTPKQLEYITDFAYEMKTLNDFHKKILLDHYKVLTKSGFRI